MTNPTEIYIGERDSMISEVAAFDPRTIGIPAAQCRYLVMPTGDAMWDPEHFSSRKEAVAHAQELSEVYGAPICWA